MPGAFSASLIEWAMRGTKIPFLWRHSPGIKDVVGAVDRAEEDDVGLKVDATLDIENNDDATLLFEQIKNGLVSQYSFGFRVRTSRMASNGVRELTDLDLLEVSAVVAGANPQTRTVSVKSATTRPPGDIHARNVLSRKIDALLGSSGSTSSVDAMRARIDQLVGTKSSSSEDLIRRVRDECVAAGLGWEEPKPKRTSTWTGPPPPLQDAVGVFGYGNLTRPEDTRRIATTLEHGGAISAEDFNATLEAAEQRLAVATEAYETAKRDVQQTRERIARYDEQHAD